MNKDILLQNEIQYFISLNEKFGITYLSVNRERINFKEEELSKFFIADESPEIGLDKILSLKKVTDLLTARINFNYTITLENIGNKVEISLEFHE